MNHRRKFLSALSLGSVALASGQTSSVAPQPATPTIGKDPASDIFQAAYQGDIPRATELAKLNPAVARLRSPAGRTPLHYAAEGGQPGMIFFLTMQGADLSAGPESPLLAAVDYPDHALALAMTQALVMNASDPNARRADGRSALDLAFARGYADIVEMLVHRGAMGPLAATVSVERVHFAMRYSFDLDGQPYHAESIDGLPQDFINEFVRLAHFDVERVNHLTKIAPGLIGARATWDELAIEAASHMGLVPLARRLADVGAPVSACTATLLGSFERVKALVTSDGGCVRERGAHDIALLAYTALGDQHPEIADFLLRSGASVQARALGGATTLHIAASKGYVELADILLMHGADVNAKYGSGETTPLMAARKAKREKMAEFLSSRGGRG